MCGIAGYMVEPGALAPQVPTLARMVTTLRHRGPDRAAVYRDRRVGLACARLAIVDPAGGDQPMSNADGSVWLIANGEIYNHGQLRASLSRAGHTFATSCDVEVILHLYESVGTRLLDDLNGEFAFAVWDRRASRLLLARDRLGIRPLFYARTRDGLAFGSEAKALLAHGDIPAAPDLAGLDQFFTFWTTVGGRTVHAGVRQLLPGHYLIVDGGHAHEPTPYWRLSFGTAERTADQRGNDGALLTRLRESVRLRLPTGRTGVYLSGGLDSAAVAALAAQQSASPVNTFSITFDDAGVDESAHQRAVADAIGTQHHELRCSPDDIGEVFPQVVAHAETPLFRTGPAPLYLLSSAVRDAGLRVVLSGEGSDELLLGYAVHKAVLIDTLAAAHTAKAARLPADAALLRETLAVDPFVLRGYEAASLDLLHSTILVLHRDYRDGYGVYQARWNRMATYKAYLSADVREALRGYSAIDELRSVLPTDFESGSSMSRAQYLDVATLLTGYLLSSQGDRMSMAHAVECRVPFLDHTLVEFLAGIPAERKIVDFVDKLPLRQAMRDLLPAPIRLRPKQAYTAPALAAFFGARERDYVTELMSSEAVLSAGLLDPARVADLMKRCRDMSHTDDYFVSEFVSLLSIQLLSHQFFRGQPPGEPPINVIVIDCSGDGDACLHSPDRDQ